LERWLNVRIAGKNAKKCIVVVNVEVCIIITMTLRLIQDYERNLKRDITNIRMNLNTKKSIKDISILGVPNITISSMRYAEMP
jgi:hypothetical protein